MAEKKRVQEKPGRQNCEHHSYPGMRECVPGSNHGSLQYLVACGTLQVPTELTRRRCKVPVIKAVALETEAWKNGKSDMVVQRRNIIQHTSTCEVNIEVQPQFVMFADAISAADASGSLLVTGRSLR